MAVDGDAVVWIGSDERGLDTYGDADKIVALAGGFVAPAFVDAHVHTTDAGLLIDGLDLLGTASLADCLDAVARYCRRRPGVSIWGHGWDETGWAERRPPTRAELDRAAAGAAVYLSRIDVHSAVVSSALLDRAPEAVGADGWNPTGTLTGPAHHHVRRAARESVTPGQRARAQHAFLTDAASRGVAVVHECAGPEISGVDDLGALLDYEKTGGPPRAEVVGYWGELAETATGARELLGDTGAHGLAGDLFCDGSIGSHTAALHAPYADEPGCRGSTFLDAGQVAAHVTSCTRVGTQAGFHVIGDAATEAVVAGFAGAAEAVGLEAVRACRHRVEHLEMITPAQASVLAACGVTASVQPAFDRAWGGPDGMYALRLGPARARAMNPLAMLHGGGVGLAFGSDAPVTTVDPWGGVFAAVHHHTPGSRLDFDTALDAHCRGGHLAAGSLDPTAGRLVVGAVASYAIWDGPIAAETPPTCRRTVHRGRVIHDRAG